jgi:hypothetical protein
VVDTDIVSTQAEPGQPVVLVKVLCNVRGCGKLLDEVMSAPVTEDLWTSYVFIHVCPKHGGGHGSVAKWVAAQKRLGRPHDLLPVGRWVQWAELRPAVEKARRTGRTQKHPV